MEENRYNVSHPLFTRDGKHLLTSVGARDEDQHSVVNVWEVSAWRRLFVLPTGWVMSLALSADGRTLAVGLVDGGAQLWDVASRKQLLSLPSAHAAQVRSVAIDPTCKWLATTCSDDSLKLWNLGDNPTSCRVFQEKILGEGGSTTVAFLPTGELLTGDEPGEVRLWDAESGQITWRHKIVEGFPDYDRLGVTALAVSPDGSKVAVGDHSGGVSLYAVEGGG